MKSFKLADVDLIDEGLNILFYLFYFLWMIADDRDLAPIRRVQPYSLGSLLPGVLFVNFVPVEDVEGNYDPQIHIYMTGVLCFGLFSYCHILLRLLRQFLFPKLFLLNLLFYLFYLF